MGNVHGGTQQVIERASRILVVDDDHEISDLLVGIFRSEGYQPLAAHDAPDALTLATSNHPDVITLDLSMPFIDGRELLRELKADKHTRHIPVVVISAFTDQLDAEDRALLAAVIQKPFEIDPLLAAISKLLPRSYR